ncbi:MAG: acetyl-CoA carboxylase carboxyltransferase subunit alpha [bacterium]
MLKNTLDFEKPIIELEEQIELLRHSLPLDNLNDPATRKLKEEIKKLKKKKQKLQWDIFRNLTPWERTKLARHPDRPYTLDYIKHIITDFVELHGDRRYGDDAAIVGGIGRFEDQAVFIIGHQKGRGTKDNLFRNFGMPQPEGYRKVLRLMKLAEKFNKPLITLIDTPGAYPGLGAEERGQSEAIATCLKEMSRLKVPIIAVVTGEGGSGGALALGVSDKILMLENSVYSVISPEGCAAILWNDRSKASDAAQVLKITPNELIKFDLIDEIVKEPFGGGHHNHKLMASRLRRVIRRNLKELCEYKSDDLIDRRYKKFRSIGEFTLTTGLK